MRNSSDYITTERPRGRPVAFAMKGIVKRFPGVLANDRVDFTIETGEIHALLGENGAGKSTLMQVLYGLHAMDAGEISVDGTLVRIASTADAIAHGIGMVHQEFMLVPSFTVVENIVLGVSEGSSPMLDLRRAATRLKDLSSRYGLAIDPWAKVQDLPVGVRQRVEILKLLYKEARLLILDEPTAVLTIPERDQFFTVLRKLRDEGHSVVIVTHKLHEIMDLADRVTIMRDGKVIETLAVDGTSERELARRMVGRDVELHASKPALNRGQPVLTIEDLHAQDGDGHERLRGVSLTVHAGEIVGIAGVDGNGQSELAECILNLRPIQSGRVQLNQNEITHLTVEEHRAHGISYIPADRRYVGSIPEMSIVENAILGTQRVTNSTRRIFRRRSTEEAATVSLVKRFGIRISSIRTAAGKLSGGNLQKLIVGREVLRNASVLIVEQPTRGLDVGAIESIWAELLRERSEGKAMLLISAELEELLNLADRIAVMYEGRIVGIVDTPSNATEAESLRTTLGLMMTGTTHSHPGSEAMHG